MTYASTVASPSIAELVSRLPARQPEEKVILDDAPIGGDVTYYRDEDDVHHVPKRAIEELIVD